MKTQEWATIARNNKINVEQSLSQNKTHRQKIFFNNTSIRVGKWQWLWMQRNNDKFCKHHGEQSLNMTKHIVEIFFNNTRDKCKVEKWQCLGMQRNNNKFCKHQQWKNLFEQTLFKRRCFAPFQIFTHLMKDKHKHFYEMQVLWRKRKHKHSIRKITQVKESDGLKILKSLR